MLHLSDGYGAFLVFLFSLLGVRRTLGCGDVLLYGCLYIFEVDAIIGFLPLVFGVGKTGIWHIVLHCL